MPATAALPYPDTLVIDHLPLVGQVVHEVAVRYPAHVDRDDLWAAGALGLVEAAGRFDPDRGRGVRRLREGADPRRSHRREPDTRLGVTADAATRP